jgi:hypothetical protein
VGKAPRLDPLYYELCKRHVEERKEMARIHAIERKDLAKTHAQE